MLIDRFLLIWWAPRVASGIHGLSSLPDYVLDSNFLSPLTFFLVLSGAKFQCIGFSDRTYGIKFLVDWLVGWGFFCLVLFLLLLLLFFCLDLMLNFRVCLGFPDITFDEVSHCPKCFVCVCVNYGNCVYNMYKLCFKTCRHCNLAKDRFQTPVSAVDHGCHVPFFVRMSRCCIWEYCSPMCVCMVG